MSGEQRGLLRNEPWVRILPRPMTAAGPIGEPLGPRQGSRKHPKARTVIVSPLTREFRKMMHAQRLAHQHQALGGEPEKRAEHGS